MYDHIERAASLTSAQQRHPGVRWRSMDITGYALEQAASGLCDDVHKNSHFRAARCLYVHTLVWLLRQI